MRENVKLNHAKIIETKQLSQNQLSETMEFINRQFDLKIEAL